MKKYDVLKVVVIVQAISMVALSIFVMWSLLPNQTSRQMDGNTEQLPTNNENEQEVIAEIANMQITKEQLIKELLEQYGDQTLQQMLIHRAIGIAAKDRGISISADELNEAIANSASGYDSIEQYYMVMKETAGLSQSKLIQDIKDHALLIKLAIQASNITEEQITNYLELRQPEASTLLQIRWIVTKEQSEARALLSQLTEGASFEYLSANHSIDAYTADQGGYLGEITSDDPFYDANMLAEASQLKIGDTSGPIEIDQGYAIIQLLGRTLQEQQTESQLRQWARSQLALQQIGSLSDFKQQLLNEYMTAIRK